MLKMQDIEKDKKRTSKKQLATRNKQFWNYNSFFFFLMSNSLLRMLKGEKGIKNLNRKYDLTKYN